MIGERALRAGGGLAAISARHPVGVSMLALSVLILGLFSLQRLGVDLLPQIIYPEVRVRIVDPGVPSQIMEDQVTRQLEEQLAITEDATSVQSQTRESRSSVDLTFRYGKDIDVALRDASTRLDRAKRFLPASIEPPVIFKLDPAQIPVLEVVLSSSLKRPAELREWVDYVFSKWFLNLPGVAAVEVGGAPIREIEVIPDQQRLAGFGLTIDDIVTALRTGNRDEAGGKVSMARQVISGRTQGRFESVDAIATLPLGGGEAMVRLTDVAQVVDTEADEKLRIRLDRTPGVKVAFQKQPQANTVAVVDAINKQLEWLQTQELIPADIQMQRVSDAGVFVRLAINNATIAAGSGAALAMLVVFLFLGDVRRTLVIGSSIPLGVMVALLLMDAVGLTLNVMTLGGIALGVGLLVDNTIVMLENMCRHQRGERLTAEAAADAAREVNGALVASTSTSLVAVLPFLFVGGLIGLLFRELIATISAAIVASLIVALTVVPALGSRIPRARPGWFRRGFDAVMTGAQQTYSGFVGVLLKVRWLVPLPFLLALWWVWPAFVSGKQELLPRVDDGLVRVFISADSGISLNEMDTTAGRLEAMFQSQPEVSSVFAQIGGFVFGRTERRATNYSRLTVQLKPRDERDVDANGWIERMYPNIAKLQLAGVRVWMRPQGIRGLRVGRGEDDVSIRLQGPQLDVLARVADQMVDVLQELPSLSNVRHSAQDSVQELIVQVDRERAARLSLTVAEVARAVRIALQGIVVTDYLEGDRSHPIRVRLPQVDRSSPRDIETIMLFPDIDSRASIYVGDVATVQLMNAPASIKRDRQQRIVELSARVNADYTLGGASAAALAAFDKLNMPAGYSYYDGGAADTLLRSENLVRTLLGLAVFLVFVVMAVQYESLRNPFIILLGVPFAAIGVAMALLILKLPLSMPMWLGMVMLTGIVVNNAIVMLEYVEQERARGTLIDAAIRKAASLRLRPILMTTLTTVVGMLPLALSLGEGAEMLQPLAISIVWGLSFSTLVTLILIPVLYRLLGRPDAVGVEPASVPASA